MKNILNLFEKTTVKQDEKIGFVDYSRQSKFSETMQNAKSIASSIIAYGKQRPIAVMIDKSCNCIDSMLGALYANDFYVVIDVKSPKERIESILHTLKNPIIIHEKSSRFGERVRWRVHNSRI